VFFGGSRKPSAYILARGCFKSRTAVAFLSSLSATSPRCLLLLSVSAGHPPPLSPLLDVGNVRGGIGPTWAHENTGFWTSCSSKHPDTSKPVEYTVTWTTHLKSYRNKHVLLRARSGAEYRTMTTTYSCNRKVWLLASCTSQSPVRSHIHPMATIGVYIALAPSQLLRPLVVVGRDENRSDIYGYRWYHICFRIFVWIWIRIRIVSTISDRIHLDIDIIHMRFEYSDTDTISNVEYPNSDMDRSKPL
jgi:hypothetical protein